MCLDYYYLGTNLQEKRKTSSNSQAAGLATIFDTSTIIVKAHDSIALQTSCQLERLAKKSLQSGTDTLLIRSSLGQSSKFAIRKELLL